MNWDKILMTLAVGSLLISFVIIFIAAYYSFTTEAKCAELGWREAKITWNLKKYCVKRVEQTDVVKPLVELETNK